MKIVFLVLAHNEPDSIIELAKYVVARGHYMLVHYDASAECNELDLIRKCFQDMEGNAAIFSKIECAWGKWSLVEAPLESFDEIEKLGWNPNYVHLMSASECFIKPMSLLEQFLAENSNFDFIEAVDISKRKWVQGGLEMERFNYFFPYSFINDRKKFERLTSIQRALGIKRKIPLGIKPRMGSQWWTLRWSTCQKIRDYLRLNPLVERYFRSTWIPDESFFQSMVNHVIPEEEIAQVQLVFHWLAPNGRPFVFKNAHQALIKNLSHFFIRKVSPYAAVLRESLKNFSSAETSDFELPTVEAIEESTSVNRNELRSRCNFDKGAMWTPGYFSLEAISKFFVIIIHSRERWPEVAGICDELLESVEYLGRPFSGCGVLGPNQIRKVSGDPMFVDRRLHSLLSSQGERLSVASFVFGEDCFPEQLLSLDDPGCISISLPEESEIVTELRLRKGFCQRSRAEFISVKSENLASELKFLKTEQQKLFPGFLRLPKNETLTCNEK
ncbi:MAG: beta-1,6-N-acetylglucosaminyltransferase [Akkermansiaceae bacterium]